MKSVSCSLLASCRTPTLSSIAARLRSRSSVSATSASGRSPHTSVSPPAESTTPSSLRPARRRSAERRLAGLKLLGVVLSAGGDTEVWGDRPDALVAETLDLLRSLAAIDESVGVRQLASRLHETLFKGAT